MQLTDAERALVEPVMVMIGADYVATDECFDNHRKDAVLGTQGCPRIRLAIVFACARAENQMIEAIRRLELQVGTTGSVLAHLETIQQPTKARIAELEAALAEGSTG